MSSVNKAILVGNLGKDPEVRYTSAGTAVANFSLATSEKIKDKEHTEWHNIQCWGKTAELAGEYLAKGKSVYLEGRIQTRKWQDKDGNDKYTTEIVAEKLVFLGSKSDAPAETKKSPKVSEKPVPRAEEDPDLIPF